MSLATPSLRVNKPCISPSQMEKFANKAEMKKATTAYGSISSLEDIQKTVKKIWRSDRPNILFRLLDRLFNHSHGQISTDLLMILNISSCCKGYQRSVIQTMQKAGAKHSDIMTAVNKISEEFAAALRNLDWTFPGMVPNDTPTVELWAGSAFLKLYEYTSGKNEFLKIFRRDAQLVEAPAGSSQYQYKSRCQIILSSSDVAKKSDAQEKENVWSFNFIIPDVLQCNFLSPNERSSLVNKSLSQISQHYRKVINNYVNLHINSDKKKERIDSHQRNYNAIKSNLDNEVKNVAELVKNAPATLQVIHKNILDYDIRKFGHNNNIPEKTSTLNPELWGSRFDEMGTYSDNMNSVQKEYQLCLNSEAIAAESVKETAEIYARLMGFCKQNKIVNYNSYNQQMSETHQDLHIFHRSNQYAAEDFVNQTSALFENTKKLKNEGKPDYTNILAYDLGKYKVKLETITSWYAEINKLIAYHNQLKNAVQSYHTLNKETVKSNEQLVKLLRPMDDMLHNVFVDNFDVVAQAKSAFNGKLEQLKTFHAFAKDMNKFKETDYNNLFGNYLIQHNKTADILLPDGVNAYNNIDVDIIDTKVNDINERLNNIRDNCYHDNADNIRQLHENYVLMIEGGSDSKIFQDEYNEREKEYVTLYKDLFTERSQKVMEYHENRVKQNSHEVKKDRTDRYSKYLKEKGISQITNTSSNLLDRNDIPRVLSHEDISDNPGKNSQTLDNNNIAVSDSPINKLRSAIAAPLEKVDHSLPNAATAGKDIPSESIPQESNPFPGVVGMADNAQPPHYAQSAPDAPVINPAPVESAELNRRGGDIYQFFQDEIPEPEGDVPSETITAPANQPDASLTGMFQGAQITNTRNRALNADILRTTEPVQEVQQTTSPEETPEEVYDADVPEHLRGVTEYNY